MSIQATTRTGTLVIAPNWLGDVVMTEPALAHLKEQSPNAKIVLLGNAVACAIAKRISVVDTTIEIPASSGRLALGARWKLGRQLKHDHFAQAIIFPNSIKSALIPYFAAIPTRTGYIGEKRYGLLSDLRHRDPARDREADHFYALSFARQATVTELPEPRLISSSAQQAQVADTYDLTQPYIVIAPGAAFGPSKQWTAKGYDTLITACKNRNIRCVLLGSKKDREVYQPKDKTVLNLMGDTSIEHAVDIIAAARAIVCNDSGLMHVASAVQTPVVALYGPTSPNITPPLTLNARIIEANEISCRPCYAKTCAFDHHACMRSIDPNLVSDAVFEVVNV